MPSVQFRSRGRNGKTPSRRSNSDVVRSGGGGGAAWRASDRLPLASANFRTKASPTSMNKERRRSRGSADALDTNPRITTKTTPTAATSTTTAITAPAPSNTSSTKVSPASALTSTSSKWLTIINAHHSDDEESAATTTETAATAAALAPNGVEIVKAAEYIATLFAPYLHSSTTSASLKNKLMPALASRFSTHWHPSTPDRGSGYRCVRSEPGKPDPSVLSCLVAELGSAAAAEEAARKVLPFAVWTDPGEVSVRLGERGHISTIHSENGNAAELTASNVAHASTPRRRASFGAETGAGASRGRSSSPGLSPTARSFSPTSSSSSSASESGGSPPGSPQMAGRAVPIAPIEHQHQHQHQQHFQFSPMQQQQQPLFSHMSFGGYGVPLGFQSQQQAAF